MAEFYREAFKIIAGEQQAPGGTYTRPAGSLGEAAIYLYLSSSYAAVRSKQNKQVLKPIPPVSIHTSIPCVSSDPADSPSASHSDSTVPKRFSDIMDLTVGSTDGLRNHWPELPSRKASNVAIRSGIGRGMNGIDKGVKTTGAIGIDCGEKDMINE